MGKLHRIKRQFNKLSEDKKKEFMYPQFQEWTFWGNKLSLSYYGKYGQFRKKVVRDYLDLVALSD